MPATTPATRWRVRGCAGSPKRRKFRHAIGIEAHRAADRRHAEAVAVAADAGDHAGDEMAGARMRRVAEAQEVQARDRARPHGEHVAQDAADPGRRALIGLDVARMVVALHLEDEREVVADPDHPRVLAGPLDHPRRLGGQHLEVNLGGLVRAVLVPHRGKYAELGQGGLAADQFENARVLLRRQAVLGDELRGDLGLGGERRWFGNRGLLHQQVRFGPLLGFSSASYAAWAKCATSPAKNPRPSVEPITDSTWFSGCGINPSTLSFSESTPAMALVEPLTFHASLREPSGAV